jgi:RNA polymerase sigma-70 factor, ECF subfamily
MRSKAFAALGSSGCARNWFTRAHEIGSPMLLLRIPPRCVWEAEPLLSGLGTPSQVQIVIDLRQPRGDVIQPKRQTVPSPAPRLRVVHESDGRVAAGEPLTDGELVAALRAEDPGAPAMLWARCAPSVGRLLAKALGPCLEIEDLTQEVFLRVFVRLPSLRDPSALRAFVLSVAMNVLKWELRRRWVGRKVRLSGTGRLPEIESTPADAEARQALRRCYRIFDNLPTKERLAFVCRYMEGMTIDEVAAALAVSMSTAKRWVTKGAAKVTEQVASDPDLRCFFAGEPGQEKEGAREP